jgi:hypothetical protein
MEYAGEPSIGNWKSSGVFALLFVSCYVCWPPYPIQHVTATVTGHVYSAVRQATFSRDACSITSSSSAQRRQMVRSIHFSGTSTRKSTNMKTLTDSELQKLAGPYRSPRGIYQYIKSLPFLGSITSNATSLIAGQWTEINITYTVGGSGLADGAWIKGTFKFYSVSDFQFNTKRIIQTNTITGLGIISDI